MRLNAAELGRFVLAHSKLVSLIMVVALYCFLEWESMESENWDDTRLIGFTDLKRGGEPRLEYFVADAVLYDDFSNITFPTVYEYESKGGSTMSISKATVWTCERTLLSNELYQEKADEFNSLFLRAPRGYFLLSKSILVFASVSLFISLTVELEKPFFNLTRMDIEMINKVNTALSLLASCIMVVSASATTFMQNENCYERYFESSNATAFCSELRSCGIGIGSVVVPKNVFVVNYAAFSSSLAVTLILTTVYTFWRTHPRWANIVRNRLGLPLQESSRSSVESPRFEIIQATREASLFLSRINDLVRRHHIVRAWNCKISPEDSDYERECPICLSSLYQKPNHVITGLLPRNSWLDQSSRSKEAPPLIVEDVESKDVEDWTTASNGTSAHPSEPVSVETTRNIRFRSNELSGDAAGAIPRMGYSEDPLFIHSASSVISSRISISTSTFNSPLDDLIESCLDQQESCDARAHRVQPSMSRSIPPTQSVSTTRSYPQLSRLEQASAVVEVPCGHEFHRQCLIQWVATQDTCPVCRAPLCNAACPQLDLSQMSLHSPPRY